MWKIAKAQKKDVAYVAPARTISFVRAFRRVDRSITKINVDTMMTDSLPDKSSMEAQITTGPSKIVTTINRSTTLASHLIMEPV